MVYFGPPEKAVGWFCSLGYVYEQWRDGAVSDWLIDLVSVGFQKPEVRCVWQLQYCSVEIRLLVEVFVHGQVPCWTLLHDGLR